MLCEKCGKNTATTRIRTTYNGVTIEANLCKACFEAVGYDNIKSSNAAHILSSIYGNAFGVDKSHSIIRCDCCGSSFEDIQARGKCGCPNCYEQFYQQLLPRIKKIQGSTKHIGKTPNKIPVEANQNENTVEALRLRLNELVTEEKYEEAAVLRDKIKQMEADFQ